MPTITWSLQANDTNVAPTVNDIRTALHSMAAESQSVFGAITNGLKEAGSGASGLAAHLASTKAETSSLTSVLSLVAGPAGFIAKLGLDVAGKALSTGIDAVKENLADLAPTADRVGDQIKIALGRGVFGEVRQHVTEFLDSLQRPEVVSFLDAVGDRLGRVTHAAFSVFDEIGRDAQAILPLIRPITDMIGDLLGSLPASTGAAWQTVDRDVSALKNTVTANNAEIERGKARLDSLKDATDAVRAHYEGVLDPLREREQIEDRLYRQQEAAISVADLQKRIQKEKALALDQYSHAGVQAARDLAQDEAQLGQLQRQQGHDNRKAALDDQISTTEKARDAQLAAINQQEKATQSHINFLEKQNAALQENMKLNKVSVYLGGDTGQEPEGLSFIDKLKAKLGELANSPEGLAVKQLWIDFRQALSNAASFVVSDVLPRLQDIKDAFSDNAGVGLVVIGATALVKGFFRILGDLLPLAGTLVKGYFKLWLDGLALLGRGLDLAGEFIKEVIAGKLDPDKLGAKWKAFADQGGKQWTDLTGTISDASKDIQRSIADITGNTSGIEDMAPPADMARLHNNANKDTGQDMAPPADLARIPVARRALGGPVAAGAGYLVGDRADHQPELFVPGSDGYIFAPGGTGRGSSSSTITIHEVCISCMKTISRQEINDSANIPGLAQALGDYLRS